MQLNTALKPSPGNKIIMFSTEKLQSIPGVGKRIAQDLLDLGYRNVDDLRAEDPEKMYQRLIALRGHHVDRCMLYVFRCATYFSKNSVHDPELLKWWNWKDRK
jgi:pathogenicity locus Cdd1 protein